MLATFQYAGRLEGILVHQIGPSRIMASDTRLNHYVMISTGDCPGPGLSFPAPATLSAGPRCSASNPLGGQEGWLKGVCVCAVRDA